MPGLTFKNDFFDAIAVPPDDAGNLRVQRRSFGKTTYGFDERLADSRLIFGDLFSKFFYPFETVSLLLLVAMIGAVILAKRRL